MKFRAWLRPLAAKFFHRAQLSSEMDEELRSHIQLRADDLERSGMPRAEAERRARIEFGGHQRYKEESYEASRRQSDRDFPPRHSLQPSHPAQVSRIHHHRRLDPDLGHRRKRRGL